MFLVNVSATQQVWDMAIYRCVHETALILANGITAKPMSSHPKNMGSQATLESSEDSSVQKRLFKNLKLALTPWIVNSLEVAFTFIFLGLCLWCSPGAFTSSFKTSASVFQSQKFHTTTCEIKEFKNRLWLVAIMNPERDRSSEGSHSLLQN